MNFTHLSYRSLLSIIALAFCSLSLTTTLTAEGSLQLNPNGIAGDPCSGGATDVGDLAMIRLYEISADFPQFAGFGSAGTTNSMCFTIKDPKEIVYIAMSGAAGSGGECIGGFDWRIVGPSGIAHGPFTLTDANSNGNDYGPVVAGPDVFNAAGYSTAGEYTFQPTEAGEYCIEIDNYVGQAHLRNFDLSVADCPGAAGNIIDGRLFSQNWAIRTPCTSTLITCDEDPDVLALFQGFRPFQNPFDGKIYVLTSDNFVQEVDFGSGSAFGEGFRGLTFSLSFNLTGPGNTGVVLDDRQSKNGSNQTFANPNLFDVYLNPPDPNCYEEGICGEITIGPILNCANPLCIEYTVTQPGLIELFIDIDGDGMFTPNSGDVFLADRVVDLDDLNGCIPWDGEDGMGNIVDLDSDFDIFGTYSQGETHFMMYDVENNNPGWEIDIVDPPCANPDFNFYWDDSLLDPADNDSGFPSQPLISLTGTAQPTHIWEDQEDAPELGFGESNTINTWFFSNINQLIAVSSCIPMIDIVKTGTFEDESGDGLAQVGETISYVFTVTNTGNTDLEDITVSDPVVTVMGAGPIDLLIGEMDNTTFTGSYTLTQADIDNMMFDNVAMVQGSDPNDGTIVMDTDPDSVMLPQSSMIMLTKTADATALQTPPQPGDIITYVFEVCNTGNTTLINVTVSDPVVTVIGAAIASLAPGACNSIAYTGSYAITSDDIAAEVFMNTAMTVGTDPKGVMVMDDDPADVPLELAPMIMLTKTADASNISDPAVVGQIITYTFEVCNTGNVDLSMVTVTDPLVTVSGGPIPLLAAGDCDNTTFTAMYAIMQGDIDAEGVMNTATATGTDPNGMMQMDDDDEDVPLAANPLIEIVKNGVFNDENGDGIAQLGETISYIFTVTNTGNVTLTNVTVTDPLVTISGGPIAVLLPGAMDMTTFTGTYSLSQTDVDAGMVDNTATTTGTDPNGMMVMDDDPESTDFLQNPEIMITKTGTLNDQNGDGLSQVGETITYTFTVVNTGNVTLTNVTVTDPIVTVSGGPIASLSPMASDNMTFTGSFTLTQADIDNGMVANTATATGTDPNGDPVMDDDPEEVMVPVMPAIDLVKTGTFVDENGDGIAQVGETISYVFTVMNTGNVTLTTVTVTDPIVTVSGGPLATLAVGATDNTTFTGTYALTQTDIDNGMVANVATAAGDDPNGMMVMDDDPEDVPTPQDPAIDLVKTGVFQDENGDGIAQVGETIAYTFVVSNTGNVTLTNVMITDPIVTVMGGPLASLAVGAMDNTTFTGVYALTQTDIDNGMVANLATTSGSDPNGMTVMDDDPEDVPTPQDPAIDIVKTGVFQDENGDGDAQVGESIAYTFVVTNTGNVSLTNVTVTDPIITVSGAPISLAVGAVDNTTFTGVYTLTQTDIDNGNVANLATTMGTDPGGMMVMDDDPEDVPTPQDPAIDLVKTGVFQDENGDGIAQVGETISYTFEVTNTGNVTLTNVTVTDPLVTIVGGPIPTLVVGQLDNTTFTGLYILTQTDINNGDVDNVASTTGTDPNGMMVMDDDPDEVPIPQMPMINIIKNGIFNDENGDGLAQPGETITYMFTVTNTGNVTLSNVTVTDPLVTVSGGPIILMPGEIDNSTFSGVFTLTQTEVDAGMVLNLATTSGDDPDGMPVVDTDPEDTPYTQQAEIMLAKMGVFQDENGDGVAQVGETIAYTFMVTNTGNVTLTNVTVTDPIVTIVGGPIASLAPGVTDNTSFTGTYALTQTDIDNGNVENLATTTGMDPDGTPVMDDDPEDVPTPQDPAIELIKTGVFQDENGDGVAMVGETIAYTFTVTNTGNVSLTNVTITDPIVTVLGGPIPTLAVGAIDNTTFTGTYILTQTDIDNGMVANIAMTSGDDPNGDPVIDDDPEDVPTPQDPGIELVKSGIFQDENGDGVAQVGETISYIFVVTNTGNVTLTDVTVTDPLVTVMGGPLLSLGVGQIDNTSFTGTYTLTQTDIDNGNVDNVATASGNDPNGDPTTDDDPEDIPTPQDPNIEIVKNGIFNDENGDGVAQPGETISYIFIVTNTGNVTLTGVTVTDPLVTVTGGPITLTPGQTDNATFTGSYILDQADVDAASVMNLATTSGTDPNGDPVMDDDPEDTPYTQQPEIMLIKTGVFQDENGDGVAQVGETISYTFSVINTGNVTLTNVTVTDPIVTIMGGPIATLAPGVTDDTTFTGTYTLTQTDVDNGNVANVATTTGSDPNGDPVMDDDPEDVDTPQDPAIQLTKEGTFQDENGDGAAQVGESITYIFTVQNTGNVTITDVTITDPLVTIMGGPIMTLAVGEIDNTTFTGVYILTQDDIDNGNVVNVAVTSGDDPSGDPVMDDDPEDVPTPQDPAIDLIKTGVFQDENGDGAAQVGETISYSFSVTNTGNVSLTNVTITDPIVTVMGGPIPTLIVGQIDNTTFTGTYTLTQFDIDAGDVENLATTSGDDPNGAPVTDDDPEETDVPQVPGIDIIKNGVFNDENGDGIAQVGETLSYSFLVTNTGNVSLTNITVMDPLVTVMGGPITLAPGQMDNITFTGTYVLSQSDVDAGSVMNTATTSGDDPNGDPVMDDDPEDTPFTQSPEILIVKTGVFQDENGDGVAQAGETIAYMFSVTNTGNTTLTNVTVTDPLVTVMGGPIASLAPGFSDNTTFTGSFTLTQDDIDAGGVANVATTSGDDPNGDPVMDDDPEDVSTPQDPSLDIIKTGMFQDENGDGIAQVGETIAYTFVVSNTGNVSISNVTVTDPLVTVLGGPIVLLPVGVVDNTTFTGVYTLTQMDIDNAGVDNVATVNGEDPNGDPVMDNDPEDTPIPQEPGLELIKSGSFMDSNGDGIAQVGETIIYTFTVTNTGNVTLTDITITDPLVTITGGPIPTLAVGAVDNTTFTGVYTLTQADIDAEGVMNVAVATGTDPNGDPTQDDDPEDTPTPVMPDIEILKNGFFNDENGDGIAQPGETLGYVFTVTNTGNVTLTNVIVTDPLITISGAAIAVLPVGATDNTTFSGTYVLTQQDVDNASVMNTAMVSGDDPNGDPVTDDDPEDTPYIQEPEMLLMKTGTFTDENGDGLTQVGETITYAFSVTNTGNVTLTDISITDPIVTILGGPITTLLVGQTNNTTFTGSYTISQDDINNGNVQNTAIASGMDPNGDPVTDDDPEDEMLPTMPGIDIIKMGTFQDENGDGIAQVGETINYVFVVQNTGNVDLTNVTVTDPIVTVIGGPIALLSPGVIDNTTFTGVYTLTQDDVDTGEVTNVATASGTDPNGNPITDNDPEVTPTPQEPAIEIVKTGVFQDENGDGIPQVGESIAYTFVVSNTGNVTLFNVMVADPLVTVQGGPISTLPVGATDNTTFTGVYILIQADIDNGEVLNTATVTSEDPNGTPVNDTDMEETRIEGAPGLDIDKTGVFQDENGDGVPQVGESISYSFVVTNTGNLTLINVTVTDPIVTVSGGPIPVLEAGATDATTFSGIYVLTLNDINNGEVMNTATVSGTDPEGNLLTDNDDEETQYEISPMISLLKSGTLVDDSGDGFIQAGETITYVFTVINTGNVTLTNITVTDPLVTVMGGPIPVLNPGDVDNTTFTGIYTVTQADIDIGMVENIAVTSGTDPTGNIVEDDSDDPQNPADVDPDGDGDPDDPTIVNIPQMPSLEIEKVGTLNDENGDGISQVGETISYSFVITNTGNVTMTNIVVTDPIVTIAGGPIASLAPGESDNTTFSGTFVLTQADIDNGEVLNTATVTGNDPNGDPTTDTDTNDTPVPDMPCIELIKTSSLDLGADQIATPGDIITYTYTVSNCGNVTLTNVNITEEDIIFTGSGSLPVPSAVVPSTLLPGETGVATATYSITQADMDATGIDNQALATGTAPDGDDVTDLSDTGNPNDPNETGGDDDPTYTPILLPPGDISGNVFEDIDNNFTGDEPLVNVQVTLIDSNGDTLITFTDQDGFYSFTDVVPGEFTLIETDPEGFFSVTDADGGDPNVIMGVLDPGEDKTDQDFIDGICDELVCNNDLQISLNVECELVLTPDMLLESPAPGIYDIMLFDEHGDYIRDDTLTAAEAGMEISYQISCLDNSCWGHIIVEANIIPQLESPCACTEDGSISDECKLLCGIVENVPTALITVEEATAAFGECGPDLIGDIKVTETITGDICDEGGEIVELVFTGKVIQHGTIRDVDILCQRYSTIKLDLDESSFDFPRSLTLDCDYLDLIEVEEGEDPIVYILGEPASILASTGSVSLSYPTFTPNAVIGFDFVNYTVPQVVTVYDTTLVEIHQILRDTMIAEIIDGVEVWVLKTVVDKVYEEQITSRLDTIGVMDAVIPIVDRLCNVLASYSDVEFDACGQGKKILRTWNLIDWCDSEVTLSANQTIEIIDITPPQIVELIDGEYVPVTSLSDLEASIEPWACTGRLRLPDLKILDNCDLEPTVHWDSFEGSVEDGYLIDLWLNQSPISVTALVSDDCDNTTEIDFNVIVVDDVPPVPVCETALQVSLTGSSTNFGIAKINAADLDEGSHDSGCGKVTITAVRIEDWRDPVRDCRDNIVGFAPQTCAPITADIDLGAPVFKNDCDATGENISQITVAGEYVKFCCEDLGQIVQVIVFVEDEQGNVNQCVVSVEVVDKSAPSLVCEDVTISCADGDYLAAPAMVGASCERETPFQVELLSENRGNNVCAGGQVVREWYVDLDFSGDFSTGDAYCQQIVVVDADTAFDPYTIKWPKHYDGKQLSGINLELNDEDEIVEIPKTIDMGDAASCTPDDIGQDGNSGGLGLPVWCDTECGLVGYTMDADTIKASDACLKIIRRWTIVDWCTYDPNGSTIDDDNDSATDSFEAIEDWIQFEPDAPGCPSYAPSIGDAVYFRYTSVDRDGYYTYDQVIVVNDDTAPEIDSPESYVVNTSGGATTKDDDALCIGEEIITVSANDLCGGEMTGASLLEWQITVIKDGDVVATKTSRGAEATMSSQEGSPGDVHIITWRVKDGCGNATSSQTVVTFGDRQNPTPFCVSGLTTAFMASDGTVAVWGAEFDFGSFDNCTDEADLRFTLVRSGEEPIRPGETGFEDQTGITFHCQQASGFDELDMWVWDEYGNGDFCTVAILISDNGDQCPEDNGNNPDQGGASAIIAGQVHTYYGMMIDDAQVTVQASGLAEYPRTDMTNADGQYSFESNPMDYNYNLKASKEDSYVEGVSTLDIVLMQRHILSLTEFESPYQLIASDASRDGIVSAQDMTQFRRLILGVTDELTTTTPWIFVDAAQVFLDEENPWPFTEDIDVNSLADNMLNEDFIGIKIGDVNQSYQGAETRTSGLLTLQADNAQLSKGDKTIVNVTARNFNQVAGYQFTMSHEGLRFAGIQSGVLEVTDENIGVSDGQMTMSWNEAELVTVAENETLFTIAFKAIKDVELKTSLDINSAITKAEAYVNEGFDLFAIDIAFGDDTDAVTLHQNQPNPFAERTTIGFDLPQAGQATLTIFDLSGKEIKRIEGPFVKGYNVVEIESKDLETTGVLYYQLESGSHTSIKKMILMK